MDKILKYDDLVTISNILNENGYGCDNVTIEIAIHTQKMLNRLNDDFFYKSGRKEEDRVTDDVSDLNISLNGVKFRYICDEEKQVDQNTKK